MHLGPVTLHEMPVEHVGSVHRPLLRVVFAVRAAGPRAGRGAGRRQRRHVVEDDELRVVVVEQQRVAALFQTDLAAPGGQVELVAHGGSTLRIAVHHHGDALRRIGSQIVVGAAIGCGIPPREPSQAVVALPLPLPHGGHQRTAARRMGVVVVAQILAAARGGNRKTQQSEPHARIAEFRIHRTPPFFPSVFHKRHTRANFSFSGPK